MSGHGDHEAAHDDDHDDHDHAAPVPEEPATPLWVTLLGVALFLIAGIVFVATRPGGKTTAELTAAPSASAAAGDAQPPPAARP